MKNILITGGCGFIGSHLAEYLLEKNFNVTVFDRYNSNNNWGNLEYSKYKKDIKVILGDVRDYDSVNSGIKKIDTIFHLAALIGIPYSYISPLAYLKTNVEGTYNVLEAGKQNNVDQIIVTSTSETYGSAKYIPIDENHTLNAQSPYAASKIAADHLALSYNKSFGTNIKIIRPFNTFGPRQSARAIIPSIISQFLGKEKKIEIGNIYPTRDYTYVSDLCDAYLKISKTNSTTGTVTNVGCNFEISIKEIYNLIQSNFKVKKKLKFEKLRKRKQKSEVDRLNCDNRKLVKLTKWYPKTKFKEGIRKTIIWMKKNKKIFKQDLYNI
tara:strand:+ start:1116 stop:2090 length:975 start_codon:yes stop_codon:yes gene_type:complete